LFGAIREFQSLRAGVESGRAGVEGEQARRCGGRTDSAVWRANRLGGWSRSARALGRARPRV